MFRDEAEISVKAGKGGDGRVSFRREKFVPRGGPDGGDGGKGGSVILRAVSHLNTLVHAARKVHFRAGNGEGGGRNNCTGADGEDVIVEVPQGTLVFDADQGLLLKDLKEIGDEVAAARGGRAGKGNKRFATATNQVPRQFTAGEEGEEKRIRLELKLIADVGLVGLPNAGKSTLLSRLSKATPKIADYPFTTLEPSLGIVELPGWRSFVMADLPGLIEGAHLGAGLGDRFLRHIERTRLIVHLVEGAPVEGLPAPAEAYALVRRELEAYSAELAAKPEILAVTKTDLPESAEAFETLSGPAGKTALRISAVTGAGLPELLAAISKVLFPARD